MNLLDYRKDKYSNTGNDGIIEKIFDILKIFNGLFVEFGAWDGIVGSNCRKLYEEGWAGIFIEADKGRYNDLVINYQDTDRILCINSFVDTQNNLYDDIVCGCFDDCQIDFCSIDIDGLDVEVFKTFNKHLPKVVCIEGGQMLAPDHKEIPNSKAQKNVQQSLSVMSAVFEAKGYKPICSYQDTFYVQDEYFNLFDINGDLMELYLDGLKAHARRIPWIIKKTKSVGLDNPILKDIIRKTNFKRYGYAKRKKWAVKEKLQIDKVVETIRERYHGEK